MNRVTALADIYEKLGRCSKELQSTQAFPWDRKDAFSRLLRTLRDMSCSIEIDEEFVVHGQPADVLWPEMCARDVREEVRHTTGLWVTLLINSGTVKLSSFFRSQLLASFVMLFCSGYFHAVYYMTYTYR